MTPLTDKQLIELLQSGIPEKQNTALRFFYRNYFGLIQSFILSNKGNQERVKDTFQDGIIVLFENVTENKFEQKSNLKTYLYSICRNLWLMELRKRKKETTLEEKHEFILLEEDYFNVLVKNEKKTLLVQLLRTLNSDCRKILELFYFKKMKMGDICAEFNLASEQVAKNKKGQCMKKIRSIVSSSTYYQQLAR